MEDLAFSLGVLDSDYTQPQEVTGLPEIAQEPCETLELFGTVWASLERSAVFPKRLCLFPVIEEPLRSPLGLEVEKKAGEMLCLNPNTNCRPLHAELCCRH